MCLENEMIPKEVVDPLIGYVVMQSGPGYYRSIWSETLLEPNYLLGKEYEAEIFGARRRKYWSKGAPGFHGFFTIEAAKGFKNTYCLGGTIVKAQFREVIAVGDFFICGNPYSGFRSKYRTLLSEVKENEETS